MRSRCLRQVCWFRAFVLLVMCGRLCAQTGPPSGSRIKPSVTGSVTEHVYLADTNAPARMATVMLETAKDLEANQPEDKDKSPIHMTSVQTALDGSFVLQKVAPGTYYVIASAPGYVSPFGALGEPEKALRNPDKALKERIAMLVPKVTVQPNLASAIDLRLERGAAVSGTVRFDDGSPASGLLIRTLVWKQDRWLPYAENGPYLTADPRTDDQGNYRISGFPSGKYQVEVDLTLTKALFTMDHDGGSSSYSNEFSLPVYQGGKFRLKDAEPITLKAGEQRPGEDLEIPLSKLHALSGMLIAARDGHIVNGGSVALLNADDKSEVVSTKLGKDSTGFDFAFVPEGDYLLRATEAKDVDYQEISNGPGVMPPSFTKEITLRKYGSIDQPLHVEGDTNGITVSVPEPAPTGTHEPL